MSLLGIAAAAAGLTSTRVISQAFIPQSTIEVRSGADHKLLARLIPDRNVSGKGPYDREVPRSNK